MKIENIKISDNFYQDFSFTHDFGYTKEDELIRIVELLESNDIEVTEETILQTLEYIKSIYFILKEKHQSFVNEYMEWRIKQKIVGSDVPLAIELSRAILIAIIGAITTVGVKWYLTKGNDDNNPIKKLMEKFTEEDEELVYEIKKTYKIKRKKN